MTRSRRLLDELNRRLLSRWNLELRTLTAERHETERLHAARHRSVFSGPVYPVPAAYLGSRHADILGALPTFRDCLERLQRQQDNDVGYEFDNSFFPSPDADVLYTIVRVLRPSRIVEIGCGHSTRVIRQAMIDGRLTGRLTCIDPLPRRDVAGFADSVTTAPVETLEPGDLVKQLGAGSILFIDTSHEVKPANDVAYLYGRVIPAVPAGTLVHLHDIFLPFEYPEDLTVECRYTWGEQYIVAALLEQDRWEVLWPGHYLERTHPNFNQSFPFKGNHRAQSLWLKRLQ